jgi:hypothetical protein
MKRETKEQKEDKRMLQEMLFDAEQEERQLAASGYPPSLAKATMDEFDYAVGLSNGVVIRFRRAVPNGQFVTLKEVEELFPGIGRPRYPLDRGIDVRLTSIEWCADAPAGS